jgi:hypothetical protein
MMGGLPRQPVCIACVVGARPDCMKMAPLVRAWDGRATPRIAQRLAPWLAGVALPAGAVA